MVATKGGTGRGHDKQNVFIQYNMKKNAMSAQMLMSL